MSVDVVISRVSEIEAMIAAANGGSRSPAAAAGASFDQQLADAAGVQSATPATASAGSANVPYEQLSDSAASKYGIDRAVLKGLIKQESGFNPNAGSPAGAQGLTQLMPGTAASLGVSDVHDPAQAIDAGAHYLRMQLDRFGGDYSKALAAYNAGPGAVQRFGGIPPYSETRNYVQNVLAFAAQYRQDGGSAAAQSRSTLYSTV
jgi:soluble lytic murein transglycosylase-like protein